MPDPIAGLTIGSGANTKEPFRSPFSGLSLLVSVFPGLSAWLPSTDEACAGGFAAPFGVGDSCGNELLEGADSCALDWLIRYGQELATPKEPKRTIARSCPTLLDITTRSCGTNVWDALSRLCFLTALRETAKSYRPRNRHYGKGCS